MNSKTLGASGPTLAALGLGCMGMSEFYGASDDAQSIVVIHRALERGVTMLDTADIYGFGANETLVGRAIADRRGQAFIATKFGIHREPGAYARTVENSPAYIKAACEASLKRLGIDVIDLYYMHRRNRDVPLEESIGAMADLVAQGKVRYLGLSEVSPDTLARAHAIHPIAAVQSEYSLWTRDIETALLPQCRALGVALVAYSPLGRGFLTGAITQTTDLASDDFRRTNPRFAQGAIEENLRLVGLLTAIAQEIGVTAAQLALAWVLGQGERVFAIPGTRRIAYLEQNIAGASLALSPEQRAALDAAFPPGAAIGARYTEAGMVGLEG